MKNSIKKFASLLVQLIIATIYLQTLYFKFSAAPESVYIFTKLGLEPFGRIGIGILELIVSILILLPNTRLVGSIISLGLISGAIFSHLGPLGIEVQGDGGQLFFLSIIIFVGSLVLILLDFQELIVLKKRIIKMVKYN